MDSRTRGDDPGTPGMQGKFRYNAANGVPAVIVSHGRNGNLAPAAGTDEFENTNAAGAPMFIARGYSEPATGCADDNNEATPLCAFDDLVVYVSPAILKNRMVMSGRLP